MTLLIELVGFVVLCSVFYRPFYRWEIKRLLRRGTAEGFGAEMKELLAELLDSGALYMDISRHLRLALQRLRSRHLASVRQKKRFEEFADVLEVHN